MKVAVDARMFATSTGRYVQKLLEYLEKIDAASEREYLVLLKSEDLEKYQPKAKNFHKLAADFKEFTFAEQLGFNKFLKNLDADLVHFTMVQQPILYRRPKVTTMHDLTTTWFKNPAKNRVVITAKQQVYKWVNKKAAHSSKYVLTPSEFVKKEVVRFTKIRSQKVIVTYESADRITEPAEPIKSLESKDFIFYVGNSFSYKNLHRLVEAFALIQKNHPNLYLALAGKMNFGYQDLQRWINKKGINNVIFTDFVDDAKLKWMYENCSAYIFPSLSEGFGLPGLEAMTHGAPVVSSNATCLPEIYGDAAIYFDPLNVDDMSEKIQRVLDNKKLRDRLIDLGYKQTDQFSWQRMAEQTLKVYKDSLTN